MQAEQIVKYGEVHLSVNNGEGYYIITNCETYCFQTTIMNMITRRKFTGVSAAGFAGIVTAPHIANAQIEKTRVIKVGLIGCGGRGTGALSQAMAADPNVVVWALADAFEDRVKNTVRNLKGYGDRLNAPVERQFSGLDAFQQLIDSGVDVVLLGTPPGFRPQHLRAAIVGGKHVFAEKPMAVDMAGVKSVMESAKLAKQKGLSIQHGFCWRYAPAVREMYSKIQSGDLGKVISAYGTYMGRPPKPMMDSKLRKDEWSDMEWQLRNWMGFEHLAGGPMVEQAIHTVDKIAWAMGDEVPVAAVGNGGRAQKDDASNTWDHYNVAFEYEGGRFAHFGSRQYIGAHNEVIDRVFLEKGTVTGPNNPMLVHADGKRERIWTGKGRPLNMYQSCHNEFFASIREGKVVNTGVYMANSTALALLGREASHSGKRVTWKQLWDSEDDQAPDNLKMIDKFDAPSFPKPGKA